MEEWPENLLRWFWQVKRDLPWRKTKDPYAIWVSEVMLQQTQVKTVIPYYHAFLERFPTLQSLAQAELDGVLEMWRGLGYYSRARHLWEGARFIMEKWEGKVPESYKNLIEIPGVGEYTAGAIASIAFNERVPVIDGNVKRVLARFLAWEEPAQKAKSRRTFLELLEEWQPADNPGDFNQALMELGATVCIPKTPKCDECPLEGGCSAHELGQELAFPVKQGQQSMSDALRLTLVIRKGNKILIKKRPASGLLANLWEFPGEEILLSTNKGTWVTAAVESVSRYAFRNNKTTDQGDLSQGFLSPGFLSPEVWFDLYRRVVPNRSFDEEVWDELEQNLVVNGPIGHTFSHRRWKIYWIVLEWPGELTDDDMRWVGKEELDKMALPVAFQKLLCEL